jgi:hypothetical protein
MDALPLTWWLYFPDAPAAAEAARRLEALDYLTLVEPSVAPPGSWLLRAAKPLDDGDYASELAEMLALATRLGGSFDGWETGWLERDEIPEALVDLGQGHLLEVVDFGLLEDEEDERG